VRKQGHLLLGRRVAVEAVGGAVAAAQAPVSCPRRLGHQSPPALLRRRAAALRGASLLGCRDDGRKVVHGGQVCSAAAAAVAEMWRAAAFLAAVEELPSRELMIHGNGKAVRVKPDKKLVVSFGVTCRP
jgi:hypothetical protein